MYGYYKRTTINTYYYTVMIDDTTKQMIKSNRFMKYADVIKFVKNKIGNDHKVWVIESKHEYWEE